MRYWLLLLILFSQVKVLGQEKFEFRGPDNQKLKYMITSASTVEVVSKNVDIGDGYKYMQVIIPKLVMYRGSQYTVTSIGSAFQECSTLRTVEIPNTVTKIGDYAFKGCTSIRSIKIPNSVIIIGKWAFERCTMLKSIEIPNSVTSIGDFAFEGCTTLNNVKIPESVISIGKGAFRYCSTLVTIDGLRPDIRMDADVFTYSPVGMKKDTDNINNHNSTQSTNLQITQELHNYIISRIKVWQKKREFETTAQYKARVTKENQQKKMQELLDEAIKDYTDKKKINVTLDSYDADFQLFKINSNYGQQYIKVPLQEAPTFKQNFSHATFMPSYIATNEGIILNALTVSINGKQYHSEQPNYTENTAVTHNIELPDISFSFDKAPTSISPKQKSVIIDNSLDTNIPSSTSNNSHTFAVIIGNEKYLHVAEVPFANNDARTFALYCQKTLGIPVQNIRKYENVTFGTMLSAISDIKSISTAYNGQLNIIFYYAGHGIPNESTKDAYLLPVDANGIQTEACYPLSRLYKELGDLGAQNVVIFMDACFSGAQRGEGMLISARGIALKTKQEIPQGNLIVFSAASDDQTAFPYKEKGHGLFTYYLLKKLQETKGECTLGELSDYIYQKVLQSSVVINRKPQTPTIVPAAGFEENWKSIRLKQ